MTTLLTRDEAADILKLSPQQVLRLANKGQLPSVRLPNKEVRFDPDDIRQWVETLKQPATAGGTR